MLTHFYGLRRRCRSPLRLCSAAAAVDVLPLTMSSETTPDGRSGSAIYVSQASEPAIHCEHALAIAEPRALSDDNLQGRHQLCRGQRSGRPRGTIEV